MTKYKLEVQLDEFPEDHNPRHWDNMGTMALYHGRYLLGDGKKFQDPADLQDWLERSEVIWLPVYMYDHSGITISTTPFSCPWDSGQLGVIYMYKEDLRKAFDWKRLTKERLKKGYDILLGEVDTYDKYLKGEVYEYYIRDSDDEIVDCCGGYFDEEFAERDGQIALSRYLGKEVA